jgi:hypothetical protein
MSKVKRGVTFTYPLPVFKRDIGRKRVIKALADSCFLQKPYEFASAIVSVMDSKAISSLLLTDILFFFVFFVT